MAHRFLARIVNRSLKVHENVTVVLSSAVVYSPDDVHCLRVAAKELRALWQLLKPLVGDRIDQATVDLRDTAKLLSGLRENHVIAETLAAIGDKSKNREFQTALRKVADRYGSLESLTLDAKVIGQLCDAFALDRGRWHAFQDEFAHQFDDGVESNEIAKKGFQRIYRKGRQLAKVAIASRDSDAWHRLRKWVKYLGMVLPLRGSSKKIKRAVLSCNRLGKTLGELHDLDDLENFSGKLNWSTTDPAHVKEACSILRRNRTARSRESRKLARKFFLRKPARFRT